jgi:hypothetical protein
VHFGTEVFAVGGSSSARPAGTARVQAVGPAAHNSIFIGADGGKRAARAKVPEKSKLPNSQPPSFVLGFCTSVDIRFFSLQSSVAPQYQSVYRQLSFPVDDSVD